MSPHLRAWGTSPLPCPWTVAYSVEITFPRENEMIEPWKLLLILMLSLNFASALEPLIRTEPRASTTPPLGSE